jgi:hypothetical protein
MSTNMSQGIQSQEGLSFGLLVSEEAPELLSNFDDHE